MIKDRSYTEEWINYIALNSSEDRTVWGLMAKLEELDEIREISLVPGSLSENGASVSAVYHHPISKSFLCYEGKGVYHGSSEKLSIGVPFHFVAAGKGEEMVRNCKESLRAFFGESILEQPLEVK